MGVLTITWTGYAVNARLGQLQRLDPVCKVIADIGGLHNYTEAYGINTLGPRFSAVAVILTS